MPLTVIGVVADVKQGDWTSEAADEVYVPLAQRSTEFGLASLTFVMRTAVDPRTVAAGIAREVAAVDPALPVSRTLTLDDVVRDELWRERLTAQLSAMFAAVALLLAAIGIYAAVAYSVSRRTREFGVRLALGSTTGHVRWLALREGLRPAAVGSALGVVAAAAGARFAERLLYGVAAFDPARSCCRWPSCWPSQPRQRGCPHYALRASIPSRRCASREADPPWRGRQLPCFRRLTTPESMIAPAARHGVEEHLIAGDLRGHERQVGVEALGGDPGSVVDVAPSAAGRRSRRRNR